MSEGAVELSFRLGQLQISVKGPLDQCVIAQRQITNCLSPESPRVDSSSVSGFLWLILRLPLLVLPRQKLTRKSLLRASPKAGTAFVRHSLLCLIVGLLWPTNCTALQGQALVGFHVRGSQETGPRPLLKEESRVPLTLPCLSLQLSTT